MMKILIILLLVTFSVSSNASAQVKVLGDTVFIISIDSANGLSLLSKTEFKNIEWIAVNECYAMGISSHGMATYNFESSIWNFEFTRWNNTITDFDLPPYCNRLGMVDVYGNSHEYILDEKIRALNIVSSIAYIDLVYAPDGKKMLMAFNFFSDCDTCGSSVLVSQTYGRVIDTSDNKKHRRKKHHYIEDEFIGRHILNSKYEHQKLKSSPNSDRAAAICGGNLEVSTLVGDTGNSLDSDVDISDYCFLSNDTIIYIDAKGKAGLFILPHGKDINLESEVLFNDVVSVESIDGKIVVANNSDIYLLSIDKLQLKLLNKFQANSKIHSLKLNTGNRSIVYY